MGKTPADTPAAGSSPRGIQFRYLRFEAGQIARLPKADRRAAANELLAHLKHYLDGLKKHG
jgi:hypothetical protein